MTMSTVCSNLMYARRIYSCLVFQKEIWLSLSYSPHRKMLSIISDICSWNLAEKLFITESTILFFHFYNGKWLTNRKETDGKRTFLHAPLKNSHMSHDGYNYVTFFEHHWDIHRLSMLHITQLEKHFNTYRYTNL